MSKDLYIQKEHVVILNESSGEYHISMVSRAVPGDIIKLLLEKKVDLEIVDTCIFVN